MIEVRLSPQGDFDNRARDYSRITVLPVASSLGAEIVGVDLAAIDDETFAEIRDALWRHKVVFVRGQRLTHGDHETFAARFGPFGVDAYTRGVPGHPAVQPIIREADTRSKTMFGSGWHTDSPFLPQPPSVTILRSVEIPPYGGDTVFADCALAYRMLSPVMQQMLATLRVHMSAAANIHTQEKLSGTAVAFPDEERRNQAVTGSLHPLVRHHPETGQPSLYVDEVYTVGIDGLTEQEARPLLDFLVRHITQHGFTCRLRWETDMVVMWDNRSTIHLAANDYDGWRREMYRTTMAGDTPA